VTFEPRRPHHGTTLVDILDRILDKGLVVAGDVRISLANVELLTIRIRLLVCSIDKAEQIGLNWWRYDSALIAQEEATTTIMRLESRISELERLLALQVTPSVSPDPRAAAAAPRPPRPRPRPRKR
jgi:Gas vesicle protein